MGILANTVTIQHYEVNGSLPEGDPVEWARTALVGRGFTSIDNTSDELSVGWVHFDDSQASHFSDESAFRRDDWFALTLRRDQRRIPGGLLRSHLDLATRAFLSNNPGLARIPKSKREELKEAVHGSLLARTLPAPAVYDAVWNVRTGVLILTSTSPKTIDTFETLFKQSFAGLSLTPLYPFRRAELSVDEDSRPRLLEENRACRDTILDQIHDNRWLGEDFLLWLLYRSMNGGSDFAACRPGPAAEGEVFTAWVNDRVVLQGESNGCSQKIAVSGPQDSFREVRAALQGGKVLREGVICMEKGEHLWRFNLKGETFAMASFKGPAVKLEKDDLTDAALEREAVFYEKMQIIEEGVQLFDSLLRLFLRERLSPGWPAFQRRVEEWLAED